ncbi:hypothetical protein [Carnobacterium inhibens]|uniref:Polymerase n=1 Tax=Carnobacterium inhibens TaxID=147709 RepID=A0ABR7TD59_9LACT|nr:hypothetical protein [Carnobacterium inhibens]MBC9825916.1 hypothetical protein [Carnobacterium inhibens]
MREKKLLTKLLFVLYLFLEFPLENFMQFTIIKYIPIIISLFINIDVVYMSFTKIKKYSLSNKKLLKSIILLGALFLGLSILKQIIHWNFNFLYVKEIIFLVFPFLYAVVLYHTDKNHSFYFNSLNIMLIIDFLIRFSSELSIESINSISFINSTSPFESELADFFLILLFYRLFIKKNRLLVIINCVLCILSFKRMHLMFIIIFFIITLIKNNKNIIINKYIFKLFEFLIVLAPIVIIMLLSNNFDLWFYNNFGISFNQFTLGRFNLLQTVIDYNGTFDGLGTVNELIAAKYSNINNLHNDSVRLVYEVSLIGYFFYVHIIWNVSKGNLIISTLILFLFSIIIVSHILTSFCTWVLVYLIIFIFYDDDNFLKEENM